MRLYVGYYAGSFGALNFENEFDVKNDIIEMLKNGSSMEEVKEYLEDEWKSKWSRYEIRENEITLYYKEDKMRIVILPSEPKLVSELERLAERIEDNAIYEVDTNVGERDYESPLWDVPKGEVKGADVKDYIYSWCRYVREKDREEPGYADGFPVHPEPLYNSFGWGGYSWDWVGDVNKITIKARDVICNVEYEWYVTFIKK